MPKVICGCAEGLMSTGKPTIELCAALKSNAWPLTPGANAVVAPRVPWALPAESSASPPPTRGGRSRVEG
jgi:hypothetical protein